MTWNIDKKKINRRKCHTLFLHINLLKLCSLLAKIRFMLFKDLNFISKLF